MTLSTSARTLWSKSRRASAIGVASRSVVEPLEGRTLLSGSVATLRAGLPESAAYTSAPQHAVGEPDAGQTASDLGGQLMAHPNIEAAGASVATSGGSGSPSAVSNPTPIPSALSPSQVQKAYDFNNILLPNGAAATGNGETIVIVDAFHDPNIQSDLHTFDQQYFGGVDPTFTQVKLGSSTNPDPTGVWEMEEALDVEWAHAMAPQASIILVEAVSNSTTNLLAAVDKAVSLAPQVVSMSWSGPEFSSEATDDSHFAAPNITFVACTNDSGAPAQFPDVSPNVLSVGGTSLAMNASGNWSSEVGWGDSGGGVSAYEPRPAYQPTTYSNGATTGITLTNRGTPDVAYDGAEESAVSVYNSFPHTASRTFNGTETGWFREWGTSMGAPEWSALIALADQGRAQAAEASLGTAGTISALYANPGDFHDIVSGASIGTPNYTAGPGYDLVTGLGSPQAPLVVSSLIGIAPSAAPSTPTGLTPTPADGKVSLLWNASSGATSWNVYRSTDGVTYTLYASVSGTSFIDSGLSDGVSYSYEVSAVNAAGESALSAAVSATPQAPPAAPTLISATSPGASTYNILRSFTSGAGYAVVASGVSSTSYTDIAVKSGMTYYYVIQAVNTAGALSAASNQLAATTIPAPPANLTATAGNSQVALTWSASFGATSYIVLRSTTNGSGYSVIASGITTTSFTDSKVTVGTTYYYVVASSDCGVSGRYSCAYF
jgi:fibronectin type 3 domain-containing protein